LSPSKKRPTLRKERLEEPRKVQTRMGPGGRGNKRRNTGERPGRHEEGGRAPPGGGGKPTVRSKGNREGKGSRKTDTKKKEATCNSK